MPSRLITPLWSHVIIVDLETEDRAVVRVAHTAVIVAENWLLALRLEKTVFVLGL
jgi:hypothetical protein